MNQLYEQGSSYSKIRQPCKKIGCQALVASKDAVSGWLRKRKRNKKWIKIFTVLHKGCVYYFQNEFSREEIESVSLFGFKRVTTATEISVNEALWPFKLEHSHPSIYNTQYFSGHSENDVQFWLNGFSLGIQKANEDDKCFVSIPLSNRDSPFARDHDESYYDSIDYGGFQETQIGAESKRKHPMKGRPLPPLPSSYYQNVSSQPQSTSPDTPPSLLPRLYKASVEGKQKINPSINVKQNHLTIRTVPSQLSSASSRSPLPMPPKLYEACVEDNPKINALEDVKQKRFSISSDNSDEEGYGEYYVYKEYDPEFFTDGEDKEYSEGPEKKNSNEKISHGSENIEIYDDCVYDFDLATRIPTDNVEKDVCFKAKVLYNYEADDDDELTICVGQQINVLSCVGKGWWHGSVDGHYGLFPANYVEKISEDLNKPAGPDPGDVPKLREDEDGYMSPNEVDVNEGTGDREDEGYAFVPYLTQTGYSQQDCRRLIPDTFRRLDHSSVKSYLKVLKDGQETVNKIRLIIVGKKYAGKTCLTRRLLKESLDNVSTTNGVELHTLKCRGRPADGTWIIANDQTIENDINARLLRCCIEHVKNVENSSPKDSDGDIQAEKMSSTILNENKKVVEGSESNENKEEPSYKTQDEPLIDYYDLYDVVDAPISDVEAVPISIWDFAGDKENLNTHQCFFRHDAIYIVTTDILDGIRELNYEESQYGLAFWLETIQCHCKIDDNSDYINEYTNPPILIVGTHKDLYEGNDIDCKLKLERQVQEIVRNSKIRRNIRKLYVVSNTDDSDDDFDILRRDIIEIAKSINTWNTRKPSRWIHLEKELLKLAEDGKPVIAKDDILQIANELVQPITSPEEVELFLSYHNTICTYIYFSDLPNYVVLNPQWLADAFRCIITTDQFQGDIVRQTEWQELRQYGRLRETLLNEIFRRQEQNIKDYKVELLKIMEKSNMIVRPKVVSEGNKVEEDPDYYVPCMIQATALSNIEESFYQCDTKTSCLCIVFDFLPPYFATQMLVACTHHFTVSRGPRESGKHPALHRDFGFYNIDETGCEKMLIANFKNVIQIQIWKWGESERHSYHEVRNRLLDIVEQLKHDCIQLNIRYSVKLKCKYSDYECLDGMVELKTIKPQREYFCEEHGNTHSSYEIYANWFGDEDVNVFSREQINATRMAIIILDILKDALYDLMILDVRASAIKPRDECDITYLYAQHRAINKHSPTTGWSCRWSDIQNSHISIGDDIERIRLARNDMAHSKKFQLEDSRYYELCSIFQGTLQRLGKHNGKGKMYIDRMKEVKKRETEHKEWEFYKKKIEVEMPRLKLKPSFEVKAGNGCTLECETLVPLPSGASIYWVRLKENSQEVELTVDETTRQKYTGADVNFPSLVILNTTKHDEGYYSCRVRYPAKSAECSDKNVVWPTTYLHVTS